MKEPTVIVHPSPNSETRTRLLAMLFLSLSIVTLLGFQRSLFLQKYERSLRALELLTVSDGPGAPRLEDRKLMAQSLTRLDPRLIGCLTRAGLSIRVVDSAEDVVDTELLHPVGWTNYLEHQATDLQLLDRVEEGRMSLVRPTDGRYGSSQLSGTIREAAEARGLSADEDIEQFQKLVEAANPDRLKKLRAAKRKEASPWELEEWGDDPRLIPLNGSLIVPNVHAWDFEEGTFLIKGHDYRAVQLWTDTSGSYRRPSEAILGGQYFYLGGQSDIVVRQDELADPDTLIHEFGHAVHHVLARAFPETFPDFEHRLEESYRRADLRYWPISEYSRRNHCEYFAEGFEAYYLQPTKLKVLDPELYTLVKEATDLISRSNL